MIKPPAAANQMVHNVNYKPILCAVCDGYISPFTGLPAILEDKEQRSEVVMSGLEKALDALFKAQDHLNTAADQGGDGLSKMIDGFNRSLRGLQRELSQVIYRLGNGG